MLPSLYHYTLKKLFAEEDQRLKTGSSPQIDRIDADPPRAEDTSEDSSEGEIWPDEAEDEMISQRDLRAVPFPREAATVRVSFTPRDFPTPSRESKKPEEDEVRFMDLFHINVMCRNRIKSTLEKIESRRNPGFKCPCDPCRIIH